MAKGKRDFPVSNIRRYLEPGPIVLVSSAWRGESNIMTMGWHTVLEFVPSLIGCVIAGGNHSFDLIRRSGECVINVPNATPISNASSKTTGWSINTTSSSSKSSKPTWRGGRNIRRRCTIPATAYSWSPARSSADAIYSGRGCCNSL
jgi:hypothetical protein